MTHSVDESNGTVLGRRIWIARKDADWTVKQLADALGVDPRTVARWQAGETEPSFERLGQIARLLGKKPSYFVDEVPA